MLQLLKSLLMLAYILYLLPTHAAAAGPSFLITAPMDIRPAMNLALGIDLLTESPSVVKVEAEILKDNMTIVGGEGLFKKGSHSTLVLPKLPLKSVQGKYELQIKGFSDNNLIFSKNTHLRFKSKSFSVFIETNSVFYKPAQEVKLRILAMSVDLKPYNSTVDIHISDPSGNLIEQWLEEETDLGVASKSFHLSDNPPTGDWSIKVKLHEQYHYQTFTVMEYVLPRFEVLLSTPVHHSIKSGPMVGTVTAKYTYGMSVKGTLSVTVTANHRRKNSITKLFEINGESKFSFSSLELKELMMNRQRAHDSDSSVTGPLDINVSVKEALTGITLNETSSVYLLDKEYYSEFYDHTTVLKPTLNFTTYLKVLRYDGKRLTTDEKDKPVKVKIIQSIALPYSDSDKTAKKEESRFYFITENGPIYMEVPLLADVITLVITAEYVDSVNELVIRNTFWSPDKTYMQIKKPNQDIKVGSPFNLTVNSNVPLKDIHYMVMSRGQIVSVGKEDSMTITLNPEISWTPEACLIVYHISDNGTLINDEISLSIQPIFKNKISVSWSKLQTRPYDKISLTVNVTDPGSLVGLSVVDKSVKLLGDRQEITIKRVTEELHGYSTTYEGQIRHPSEVFEKCNIGVLTDVNLQFSDYMYNTDLNFEILLFDDYILEEKTASSTRDPELGGPPVRSHFPETWIWKHIDTGSRTDFTLNVDVPDTITSWITNAFVISENLGFGILSTPVQLETFQPFFIFLNLPTYVIRGEQFALEVVVFNYLKEDSEVLVILESSDAFEVMFAFVNESGSQQAILVPSQEGKRVFFPIKPIKLGEIAIKVKAISSIASDALSQKLLVKAEGIEYSYSQTMLLELNSNKPQNISKTLDFTFPLDVVSGSEKAFISIVGDVLGPSINGIQSLIQLPYGCGEQNMVKFAPNIFVMEYLTNTKQLNDKVIPQLLSFMKEGYQRELTFQRKDGSFSAFGNQDPSGSTWLSAFVLQCFLKARPFILVDPVVLHKTLTWLLKHQKKNGEFEEPGKVLHTPLQGGQKSPVTLTAYIMAALIEYPGLMNSNHITDATNYLESQMNEIVNDNYTLSLVTYALSLAGRSKAKEGLDILNKRAEQEGDLRFWKLCFPKASGWWQPCSTDVEMASYVLLSHIKQNRLAEGLPVMKWLSQQRNHLGGFSSTQDTILALQAMSSFASVHKRREPALSISVHGENMSMLANFTINSANQIVLQKKEIIVEQPLKLNIHAEGVGFAILQLHVIYNLRSSDFSERQLSIPNHDAFDLGITILDDQTNVNAMNLKICTRYLETESSAKSGMAVMQVDLLSGFSLSPKAIALKYPINKVETSNGNVNIYFDSLNKTPVCVDIPTNRESMVGYTQDAFVSVFDYYEPGRRAVRSYNSEVMQTLSLCQLCKEDCSKCTEGNHSDGLQQPFTVKWLLLMLLLLQSICVF
ncbi:CD109 antigen [Pelobates cultripes]|uniref:CD109 antigen n=1 Tax=Pelobates cultripes TaxID=61616 RepID=A0AAD1RD23_PELCU|nr:CD109 antigen [Pelobates cultripes]CAH2248916.1 CD109 antigen [Pelobates cultripes]CAH2248917.1 CD109 antigen [Pelobates cultripes]CAH2248918.1 CD109 antigen [Pelobates cultripes]CAH2248919.1 CD109 antigen [Pelobates cultripes]